MKRTFSRRDILRIGATGLATSTVFGRLGGPLIAHAGNPYVTGYKALVCINLLGGNQGFNMVVPTTQSAYGTYATSRSNLAIAQNTLLALNGQASDGNAYVDSIQAARSSRSCSTQAAWPSWPTWVRSSSQPP